MNHENPVLNLESCRLRQKRLTKFLNGNNIEFALLVRPKHVQYFTGFRPASVHQAAVVLSADGRTYLAVPNSAPNEVAADEVVAFEAQWCCTLRQDQMNAALDALFAVVPTELAKGRIGVEFSVNPVARRGLQDDRVVDLEPAIWSLRRKKDEDELRMIRRAIDCTDAMYECAREMIQPGITELDVYNDLHAAAVYCAGEPLLAVGNDFQCNSPGGPPRTRSAQAGELFILDLGVSFRGYYSDNCRTFSVDRSPTDEQLRAWKQIVRVLDMVEQTVRPGVSAKTLYQQARNMLDDFLPGAFFHHLGHGIGLFPHEGPHLNDHWDDHFEIGDVFTAEPGLYAPHLQAGIRLEQDYLVTETGVERLTNFPLSL